MGTLAQRFPAIGEGKVLRAGTPGVEMWEVVAPQDGDIVVEKIRQSGFHYTKLEAVLRELGRLVDLTSIRGEELTACEQSDTDDERTNCKQRCFHHLHLPLLFGVGTFHSHLV